VNSSTVLVNASTRFRTVSSSDSAPIGISTTKIHAFGPMGLEELTTQKFIIYGDGQIGNSSGFRLRHSPAFKSRTPLPGRPDVIFHQTP
jgi:hypothetical protein